MRSIFPDTLSSRPVAQLDHEGLLHVPLARYRGPDARAESHLEVSRRGAQFAVAPPRDPATSRRASLKRRRSRSHRNRKRGGLPVTRPSRALVRHLQGPLAHGRCRRDRQLAPLAPLAQESARRRRGRGCPARSDPGACAPRARGRARASARTRGSTRSRSIENVAQPAGGQGHARP